MLWIRIAQLCGVAGFAAGRLTITADSSSECKQVPATGPRRIFGLAPTIILASLATAWAAVLSASGHGSDSPRLRAALPVTAASGDAGQSAIELRTAAHLGTGRDAANVEALIDTAARKYRISSHAMRELVHTAYAEAKRNRLDPLLIIAVMAVESRFNPIAQSDGGATGLMQIIPQYHRDKFSATAGESVLDPRTNIKVGAQVLKEYIVRGGTEAAGLQLYNGASWDASNAYANRVLAERARLRITMRRAREPMGAGLRAMS